MHFERPLYLALLLVALSLAPLSLALPIRAAMRPCVGRLCATVVGNVTSGRVNPMVNTTFGVKVASIQFNASQLVPEDRHTLDKTVRLSLRDMSIGALLSAHGHGCGTESLHKASGQAVGEGNGTTGRATSVGERSAQTRAYDDAHTMKLIQIAGRPHRRKLASQGDDEDGEGDADEEEEAEESNEEAGDTGEEVVEEPTKTSIRAAAAVGDEQGAPPMAAPVVVAAGGRVGMGDVNGLHANTNVTHLSMMLLKIIKSYNIRSMVDIPCRNTLDFVPTLLNQLDFEIAGFKYYCVDTANEEHEDIAHLFGDAGSPDIIHMRADKTSRMPKTDLVFSWNGPQDWGVTSTWTFFTNLRQIRPKYLLITNNPGENNGDKPNVVNLRKQPFHVSLIFFVTFFFIPSLC